METLIAYGIALAVLSVAIIAFLMPKQAGEILSNIAEGTHIKALTKLTDAALPVKYLLVKVGSDADHIAINGASDSPLGICPDEASGAEAYVSVQFLNATDETRKVVASEAITVGTLVYTAASGKVSDLSASAGTYYLVGRALTAAGADGDVIEIEPCFPVATVVT